MHTNTAFLYCSFFSENLQVDTVFGSKDVCFTESFIDGNFKQKNLDLPCV